MQTVKIPETDATSYHLKTLETFLEVWRLVTQMHKILQSWRSPRRRPEGKVPHYYAGPWGKFLMGI